MTNKILLDCPTPCYVYDMGLLRRTLDALNAAKGARPDFRVHYAVKANPQPEILTAIAEAGLGADTVSGGELHQAIDAGFSPGSIVLAGVGKTDKEIADAIGYGIESINVESIEEIPVIAAVAREAGRRARIALRINPDIDAHTHHYITTGLKENKFGIDRRMLGAALETVEAHGDNVELVGLHFHIGSQITNMEPYRILCRRALEIAGQVESRGFRLRHIDLGGGLGVDYDLPLENPIPDFKAYFDVFAAELPERPGLTYHFEPGRAIVAQCGSLLSTVLYVKRGIDKNFVILDAGMTDLLRPALYGALHQIIPVGDISGRPEQFDVVGPVCESADVFATSYTLPSGIARGNRVAILTAGAYGQSMSSHYNSRELCPNVYLD